MRSAAIQFFLTILTILVLLFLYQAGILDQIIRFIISKITGTEDVLKMINQITG